MGATETEKKVAKEKNPFTTNVGFTSAIRSIEPAGETPYGVLWNELVQIEGKKKEDWAKIKRSLDKVVKVADKDIVISQPITVPPSIVDPEKYYPVYACRMTQTRFDELDYAPTDAWKAFPLTDGDGLGIRDDRGNIIIGYFFSIVVFESVAEKDECTFITMKPSPGIVIVEGKSFIKGEVVLSRQEAKDTLSMFNSYSARRRAEEDEFVVQV
jgi:hypothetical protein